LTLSGWFFKMTTKSPGLESHREMDVSIPHIFDNIDPLETILEQAVPEFGDALSPKLQQAVEQREGTP